MVGKVRDAGQRSDEPQEYVPAYDSSSVASQRDALPEVHVNSLVDTPPTTEPPVSRLVPRITPLTAARRHWFIVAFVTLLFTGAGVAAGWLRPPQYTAQARLVVGRIDVSAPGALGSFTAATQALASQYSRTIDAQGVTRRVARRAGMTPQAVAARVSATPIPQSPVMKVFATDTSAAEAVRLANLASDALVSYTTALNRSNPDTARLLSRYAQAAGQVVSRQARLRRQLRRYDAKPSRRKLAQVQRTRVDLRVAQLRSQTLRNAYSASTESQAATALVQVLERAFAGTSDRMRYVQFLGFLGFVAGIAAGLALATLRANRLLRRSIGF
jgi:uncharacterized protein involved in exopolysaccharide biosynthesis